MIEQQVEIRTPEGTPDALLVRPDSRDPLPARHQPHRWPRIPAGIRGSVEAHRRAWIRRAHFANERSRERFRELRGPLTPDAMACDASAYIDFLDPQPIVSRGPMGVIGNPDARL